MFTFQNRHITDMDCPFPVQSIPGGFPFLPFRSLLMGMKSGEAFTSPESFADMIQLLFVLKAKKFIFSQTSNFHNINNIHITVQHS